LHARPATFFIQKANTYKSSVWVENGTRKANAKSLLGILSLAVSKGDVVTLIAEGADEAEAVAGLSQLITDLED
jgi:phosphocarrier protein